MIYRCLIIIISKYCYTLACAGNTFDLVPPDITVTAVVVCIQARVDFDLDNTNLRTLSNSHKFEIINFWKNPTSGAIYSNIRRIEPDILYGIGLYSNFFQ